MKWKGAPAGVQIGPCCQQLKLAAWHAEVRMAFLCPDLACKLYLCLWRFHLKDPPAQMLTFLNKQKFSHGKLEEDTKYCATGKLQVRIDSGRGGGRGGGYIELTGERTPVRQAYVETNYVPLVTGNSNCRDTLASRHNTWIMLTLCWDWKAANCCNNFQQL